MITNTIWFPCNTEALAIILINRAKELGWNNRTNYTDVAKGGMCLVADEKKRISWNPTQHTYDLGQINDLLFTNKYLIKSPPVKIYLGQYTAEISDVIKVGCVTISGDMVEEIYAAFKKYNSK